MTGKTLLLLRHAKSSWKQTDLADHDRPLKRRGQNAALRMGRLMQEESLIPDVVLCSTAVRARQTAELVLQQCRPLPPISFLDDLYHAEPDQIARILSQIEKTIDCVLVIGHNPGLEEFCSRMTETTVVMPTAALAKITTSMADWNEFTGTTRGVLKHLWCPRELDSD